MSEFHKRPSPTDLLATEYEVRWVATKDEFYNTGKVALESYFDQAINPVPDVVAIGKALVEARERVDISNWAYPDTPGQLYEGRILMEVDITGRMKAMGQVTAVYTPDQAKALGDELGTVAYLIEELWIDPSENEVGQSRGYRPVEIALSVQTAERIVSAAGIVPTPETPAWPNVSGMPYKRYSAIPIVGGRTE